MATASSSLARERHHAPLRKRCKHAPTPKCESLFWTTGRAIDEAKSLIVFMKNRGATREEIISLIAVTDAEYQSLCAWAADKPRIASRLNDIMSFQDRVLRAFLFLVEEHEANIRFPEEGPCKQQTSR